MQDGSFILYVKPNIIRFIHCKCLKDSMNSLQEIPTDATFFILQAAKTAQWSISMTYYSFKPISLPSILEGISYQGAMSQKKCNRLFLVISHVRVIL